MNNKKYILLLITILLSFISFAQPAINKMIQDELQKLPPEQRAMVEQMMKKQMAGNNAGGNNMIPIKRPDILAKIPKLASAEQYNAFLAKLKTQAAANIAPGITGNVNSLIDKYRNNKTGLNNLPVILFMQGQVDAAVYAAIVCAQLNSDVQLSQNNLAFVLHQLGYPHHAIPLLEYYLSKSTDAVMFNNAGQCYFTLGDTAKAAKYFKAALRLNDNLAEAHCGTALMLLSQKKGAEATQHITKAFRDGYSEYLEDATENHNIKLRTDEMLKPVTEYFKPVDYSALPPVRDRKSLIAKYEKVQELQSIQAKWEASSQSTAGSFKIGNREWETNMAIGSVTGPFKRKALMMSRLLQRDLQQYIQDNAIALQQIGTKVAREYNIMEQGIEKEYKTGSFNSMYDQCKMKEKYLDAYLVATFTTQKKAESILHLKLVKNVNQQLHWLNFLLKPEEYKHQYFGLGSFVLSSQIGLSGVQQMYPLPIDIATACDKVLDNPPNPDDIEGVNGDCSYSIKIPAVVGSVKLTCDGWEIEGGEGIVVNLIQDNKRGEFTIAFGPGIEASGIAASAGAKAQFYITASNKTGTPSDFGFRGEVKSEFNAIMKQYEAGYSGQIGISGIKMEVMDGTGNGPAPIFNYDPKK